MSDEVSTTEEWRDVPGWEGFYQVSDAGRVRTLPRRVRCGNGWTRGVGARLRKLAFIEGYAFVGLSRGGTRTTYTVHNLVLTAFVGPRPDGMQCCHGDGDPGNNRLGNLRWDSPVSNWRDRVRHGRSNRGSGNAMAVLTDEAVRAIRARYVPGTASVRQMAADYGVTIGTIYKVLKGASWKHVE